MEIIIAFMLMAFFYFAILRPRLEQKRMKKDGIMATAIVIKAIKTDISSGNDIYSMRFVEFILEIEGDNRKVNITQEFKTSQMPKAGDRVNLLIDSKNPSKIIITRVIDTKTINE